jgi:hypothetical protein
MAVCKPQKPPKLDIGASETGALNHANSGCAASGLNDLDSTEGQTESQVQTAADSWKFEGLMYPDLSGDEVQPVPKQPKMIEQSGDHQAPGHAPYL